MSTLVEEGCGFILSNIRYTQMSFPLGWELLNVYLSAENVGMLPLYIIRFVHLLLSILCVSFITEHHKSTFETR